MTHVWYGSAIKWIVAKGVNESETQYPVTWQKLDQHDQIDNMERTGSVVECLNWDRRVAG